MHILWMQEGQLSLLAGEGRATYRPVNGDISYNTAGSSQAAAGQFSGQFAGQAGRTSYTPQEYDGYDDRVRILGWLYSP